MLEDGWAAVDKYVWNTTAGIYRFFGSEGVTISDARMTEKDLFV